MNNKKLSSLIAITLTVALLVPFTATANSNIKVNSKTSTACNNEKVNSTSSDLYNILKLNPQISSDRATIAQLNSEIIALKQQAKALVEKIQSDLKGTHNVESITSTQNYKDIVTLLKSLKETLGKAEARNYISGLKNAKCKNGNNLQTDLNNIVPILTQKKADLTAAIANLNVALIKADAIAALKTSSTSTISAIDAQIIADKQIVDQNTLKIAASFAENRNIISQIIATASANKTILQADPNDVASIETQLKAVTTTLKGIYNGSVANNCKHFNTCKKNKDDTAMLNDLAKIISIQQTRISTLAATKLQLQDILTKLNTIISSSKASA